MMSRPSLSPFVHASAWIVLAGSVLAVIASHAPLSLAQMSQSDNPSSPSYAPPADSLFSPQTLAQGGAMAPLPAVPMPQDRAGDSYSIYQELMPVGELGSKGWPRDLWLLSDTTVSIVPPNVGCLPDDYGRSGGNMNPHTAVVPPSDAVQDFNEMLEDFDRTCHERVHLTPESFTMVVPLRLLTPSEQDEFVTTRYDPNAGPQGDLLTAKYKGAPGLSSFSQVYFNAHHTVAMVYATGWCGGVCQQSYWQVLGVENGQWKRLGWKTAILES